MSLREKKKNFNYIHLMQTENEDVTNYIIINYVLIYTDNIILLLVFNS